MFSPGDVLLYEAPSLTFANLVPRLIRLVTGNKVTHVALYIEPELDDNHFILEALFDGIAIKTISEAELYNRLNGFKLKGVARLPNVIVNRNALASFAIRHNNKKYGLLTILNLLLQHGKTRLFPKKEWSVWFKSKDAYTCSELTQLALEEYFKPTKAAALVEPDDYLGSPWKIT